MKSLKEMLDDEYFKLTAYHGCFTGDCPHKLQRDCNVEFYNQGALAATKLILESDAIKDFVLAMKFYANPDKYDFVPGNGKTSIQENDCETNVREPFMDVSCGGRRARKALKQFEEFKKESLD